MVFVACSGGWSNEYRDVQMRIFISGAITHNPEYKEQFARAEVYLKAKGYKTINPATVCSTLPDDLTHSEYMAICFPLLDISDGIYMIDGWRDSKGALMEYGFAIGKGYKVLYEGKDV